MRACALFAIAWVVSTSGCCTFYIEETCIAGARPIEHTMTLVAVTIAPDTQGKLEPHVCVRLEDGRELHYADVREGKLHEVEGPLPLPSVPLFVVRGNPFEVAPTLAPGESVQHVSNDGELLAPAPCRPEDLRDAYAVIVAGDLNLGVADGRPTNHFEVTVCPPHTGLDATSNVFALGPEIDRVLQASVERRNGKLVCELLAAKRSGERIRFESVEGGPLQSGPFEDDLPRSHMPIVVTDDLDFLDAGVKVQRVEQGGTIARSLTHFTPGDAREAAIFEIDSDKQGWHVRFRLPPSARLADDAGKRRSLWAPHEVSFTQVVGAFAFAVLLPATLVIDVGTFPIQVVVFASMSGPLP